MHFCGRWLSDLSLLPSDLLDIHECEMYDCRRHAYRDRVNVVSFQVVPDQWLQTVIDSATRFARSAISAGVWSLAEGIQGLVHCSTCSKSRYFTCMFLQCRFMRHGVCIRVLLSACGAGLPAVRLCIMWSATKMANPKRLLQLHLLLLLQLPGLFPFRSSPGSPTTADTTHKTTITPTSYYGLVRTTRY